MRPFNFTTLSQVIGFSLLSLSVSASEQPDAESLVGNTYIGGHGMYINTDNDRLFTTNPNSSIAHGSGVGGEFGYRVSPFYEARLSLTNLNINTDHDAYDVPSGSSIAMDLLYFPQKQNFYVVAGANFLDVNKSDLSADLGAGYRHYLSNNSALYVEGKGHYQLDDNYMDFSTKVGFIYYFGTKAAAPVLAPKANKIASVSEKDSDKDGIVDSKDICANTPSTDKVDAKGCTVFGKKETTMELLVNFDNNKSIVKPNNMTVIGDFAEFLTRYPQIDATINGHSSSVGNAEYNQQLSQKRAQAIVDVLVKDFRISARRLTAVGHGEEKLLNTANTAEAHAQNRRIEATITGVKKVVIKR